LRAGKQTVTIFRRIVPALLAAVLCVPAASFADAQKAAPRKHPKKQKKAEAPLPPYTPITLSPLPLDQVPAVPPQVTYQGGRLTIVAHNSTLGDILRAVHKQTGADLEVPSNANERVVADLGPGPARDVLADLLNGSHFNYVMVGSPTDPTQVQRVVLTSKMGPDNTAAVANAAPPGQMAGPQDQPTQGNEPNRFGAPIYMPSRAQMFGRTQGQNQPQAEEPEPQADDNADATDDNAGDQAEENNEGDQQNQGQPPKTPEQLLQELQRQQQLQQGAQPGQPAQPAQPQIVYPNGLPNGNPPPANAPEQ
jgi:hypothetical protein